MPVPLAYLLRRVDGEEPIGPYTRSKIRQLLYTRELSGRERVRVPGHDVPWAPLAEQEAFKDILSLLDIQVHKTSRIKGWQAMTDEDALETDEQPAVPTAAAAPSLPQTAPPSRMPVVIALVVALIAITGMVLSAVL
jgi:hypothetical protein